MLNANEKFLPEKTFVSVPMGTLRRKLLAASANMPRTLTLRNM